jgi:peptidyl-tRNA hydrolase, PTH1 family
MSISLVAALGNPGREYADTRHNFGWVLIDAFADRLGLSWRYQSQFEADVARWDRPGQPTCFLAKPLTYMNESGRSLAALARFYKIAPSDVVVVYDEYTIDLGLLKVSTSGSAGGHNGVDSVIRLLGDGFIRYRLGIGPKEPRQMDIKDFVLGKFTPAQQSIIATNKAHYLNGLNLLLNSGVERAMTSLNRRDTHETDQP